MGGDGELEEEEEKEEPRDTARVGKEDGELNKHRQPCWEVGIENNPN